MKTKTASLCGMADALLEFCWRAGSPDQAAERLHARPELLHPTLDRFFDGWLKMTPPDSPRRALLESRRIFLRECRRLGISQALAREPGRLLADVTKQSLEHMRGVVLTLASEPNQLFDFWTTHRKYGEDVFQQLSAVARGLTRLIHDDAQRKRDLEILEHVLRRMSLLGPSLAVVEAMVAVETPEIAREAATAVGDLLIADSVADATLVLNRYPELKSTVTVQLFIHWSNQLKSSWACERLRLAAARVNDTLVFNEDASSASVVREYLNAREDELAMILERETGTLLTRNSLEAMGRSIELDPVWSNEPSCVNRLKALSVSREREVQKRRRTLDVFVDQSSAVGILDLMLEHRWLADALSRELIDEMAPLGAPHRPIVQRTARVGAERAVREQFDTLSGAAEDFVPLGYTAVHRQSDSNDPELTRIIQLYQFLMPFAVSSRVPLERGLEALEQLQSLATRLDAMTARSMLSDVAASIFDSLGAVEFAEESGRAFGLLTEAVFGPGAQNDPPELRGRFLSALGRCWLMTGEENFELQTGIALLRSGLLRLRPESPPWVLAHHSLANGLVGLAQRDADGGKLWTEALQHIDLAATYADESLQAIILVARAQLILAADRAGHPLESRNDLYSKIAERLGNGYLVGLPQERQVATGLGYIAAASENWDDAIRHLEHARQLTVDRYSEQQSRLGLLSALGTSTKIFVDLAFALAVSGQVERAVETLEFVRGMLAGELSSDAAMAAVALDRIGHATSAERLRKAMASLLNLVVHDGGATPPSARRLREVRSEFQSAYEEGCLLLEWTPPSYQRSFHEIQLQVSEVPVVYLIASEWGGGAIVVRDVGKPKFVRLKGLIHSDIEQLAITFRSGESRDRRRALERFGSRAGASGLIELCASLAVEEVAFVVVGTLAWCPIQSAKHCTPAGTEYLIDVIACRYLTSVFARQRSTAFTLPRSVVVVAPDENASIPRTRLEVSSIGTLTGAAILSGSQASIDCLREALHGSQIAHFACHGVADAADPMSSRLLLANGRVEARDFLSLDVSQLELVVLSACESSVVSGDIADELLSLPRILQLGGVKRVIGSRWAVKDAPTAELMIELYRQLGSKTPAQALRAAQITVRDSTKAEKRARLGEVGNELLWSLASAPEKSKPFADSWNWAAFELWGP